MNSSLFGDIRSGERPEAVFLLRHGRINATFRNDIHPMEMKTSYSLASRLARRLRQETRLLGFVTAMAFLSGFVMYMRYDISVLGMPLPLFTGLFYAGFIGTAATIVSLVLPALRAMIEAAAISRLGVALAAYGVPEFGLQLTLSPLLSATIVILGAIIVRKLFCFETFAHLSLLAPKAGDDLTGHADPA